MISLRLGRIVPTEVRLSPVSLVIHYVIKVYYSLRLTRLTWLDVEDESLHCLPWSLAYKARPKIRYPLVLLYMSPGPEKKFVILHASIFGEIMISVNAVVK